LELHFLLGEPLKAEQALGAWFHKAEIIPCYFLYQLSFQYAGNVRILIGQRRNFHIDAGYRFIRFDDALKCNAGSPFLLQNTRHFFFVPAQSNSNRFGRTVCPQISEHAPPGA
jgi:hypothetical protein